MIKIIKKIMWTLLCLILFVVVFGISTVVKLSSITGIDMNSFTLQGKEVKDEKYEGEIIREKFSIPYITNKGDVEERQIIVLKPSGMLGDLPLVYIPHYEVDENTEDFNQYMKHGWAVASPVFKGDYNGNLADDDLVFNNACFIS